jgi:hypothetical protein
VAFISAHHDTHAWHHTGRCGRDRSILESELDWLDNTQPPLSGGRSFSRADITVANLLAFFARPREMPTYHQMSFPGALLADLERWLDLPVMRWVVEQYRTRRVLKHAAG